MLPTLRQLQYLKLLVEHGSFSRAAEAAHVTQPTLSARVQEVGKILGAPGGDPDHRTFSAAQGPAVAAYAIPRAASVPARRSDRQVGGRAEGGIARCRP